VFIEFVCLVEVFTGQVEFLNQEVVAAHSEPSDCWVWVRRYKFVSDTVEVWFLVQFDQDSAVERDHFRVVAIFTDDFIDTFFGFLILLAGMESLGFDRPNIEILSFL
jgi:hypothetical protein